MEPPRFKGMPECLPNTACATEVSFPEVTRGLWSPNGDKGAQDLGNLVETKETSATPEVPSRNVAATVPASWLGGLQGNCRILQEPLEQPFGIISGRCRLEAWIGCLQFLQTLRDRS